MIPFEDLKTLVQDLETELTNFYTRDNKAAGTRARVKLQQIKALAKDIRRDVLETKSQRTEKKKS